MRTDKIISFGGFKAHCPDRLFRIRKNALLIKYVKIDLSNIITIINIIYLTIAKRRKNGEQYYRENTSGT